MFMKMDSRVLGSSHDRVLERMDVLYHIGSEVQATQLLYIL